MRWQLSLGLHGTSDVAERELMMAIISVVTFQVAPGRLEDFLAAARNLRAIEVRLAMNLTAMRL